MNHHLLGGLTAAFVMSGFGVPLSSHAQELSSPDPTLEASSLSAPANSADSPSAAPISETPDSDSSDSDTLVAAQETPDASAAESLPATSSSPAASADSVSSNLPSITSIYPHTAEGQAAATLFLQDLPVLTFLGEELTAADKSATASLAEAPNQPEVEAQQVAQRLEAFVHAGGDAEQILARWDDTQDAYVVDLAEETLVVMGEDATLPDATGDLAEDTLQAANRLRRLLGNAPPLEAVEGEPAPPEPVAVAPAFTGMASWYGPGFHGRRSASGEVFNQNELTAAHRTLPFGTQVRVTNLRNNRQVTVRINDRGPFSHGRIIDLSAAAAQAIGLRASGVGQVRIEVLAAP